MSTRYASQEVSLILWLWSPLSILALPILIKILDDAGYDGRYGQIMGEQGIVENITLLVLAVAVFFGIRLLLWEPIPGLSWLKYWVVLLLTGSIYFLGEEASWGQHLFDWGTPKQWRALNKQGETNLHNLEGIGFLFDKVPRFLLSAAALIGGVLVPVYRHIHALQWTPMQFNYWLWPTWVCTPSALLAVLVSVPKKLYGALVIPPPELLVNLHPGELKECFLAFFIMLYLVSLAARITNLKAPT